MRSPATRAAMSRPDPWRTNKARYPFTAAIPTRWADLDLLGHINNFSMSRRPE